MLWTEEADQLLISLWNSGGSLTSVAHDMQRAGYTDLTRNMVAGRKHRLPKESFRAPTRPPPHLLNKPRSTPRLRSIPMLGLTMSVSMIHDSAPPDEPDDGVDYLARRENGCRAILDRRGHWGLPMVCGVTQAKDAGGNNTSYCAKHLKLYTNPPQRR
jgi:hypothetical protein